ncbi:hypothetical protein JQ032_05645 [Clostridium botulinum]|nr:hypothetical protein [Clostridium botulinum]
MIGGLIGLIIIDYKLTALILLIIPIRYTIVNYFAKKEKNYFKNIWSIIEIIQLGMAIL